MRVFRAVEMWCRRQAAAAILPLLLTGFLTGESSEALTTFGKSNTPQPYQPPAPTSPPARECSSHALCAGISGTSCVRTNYDSTMRCLCGDNHPPVNGRCTAQTKGLRHMCVIENNDCHEGLTCQIPNTTDTGKQTWRQPDQPDKQTVCLCDTENGYVEKDNTCNDAEILKTSFLAILAVCVIKNILD